MENERSYGIGECEICGGDSYQSFGTGGPHLREHICCTRCKEMLETELLALDDNEPAGKAYDRAKIKARMKTKIRQLKAELEKQVNK
jgi:hypothetical protein